MEETDDGAKLTLIRNENVDTLRLEGPEGSTGDIVNIGDSVTIADGDGIYTVIAILDDRTEELLKTKSMSTILLSSGTVTFNPPAEGVVVESFDSEGNLVDSDITDSAGVYNIENSDSIKVNSYDATLDENRNINLNIVSDNSGVDIPTILMNGDGSEKFTV